MSRFDLGYLIAPHAVADFLARHWEKSALLIKRDEADRFQALFPASDIQAVLLLADHLPADVVELIGQTNAAVHKSGLAGGLPEFFWNGATIRVRGIQEYCDPLKELCHVLEREFGFPTRANLYCTPANSRGFDLHFDTHEVLVLQLVGKKRWQVYQPAVNPLSESAALPPAVDGEVAHHGRADNKVLSAAVPGSLECEEVLVAGDSLYLPSGFFHQAVALDEPSVHLTIGIHVRPRESGRAVSALTANQIWDTNAKSGAPDLELLDHETKLTGIDGLQLYFSADGSTVGLARGQEVFWMPACFAPALRFVVERHLFCVRELPGEITVNSKLSLVRRLIEDGFVRIAD